MIYSVKAVAGLAAALALSAAISATSVLFLRAPCIRELTVPHAAAA